MGAHCSAGASAVECRKACANAQIVQVMDCSNEGQVNEEVLANCNLLRAARDGNIREICDALERGAELEVRTSKYVMLPMKSWGEEADNAGGLLPTSSGSYEPQLSIRFGLTPLMISCKEGHMKAVQLLVAKQAYLHTEDEDGMRPLHFAAEAGSLDCCTLLVQAGASTRSKDDAGRDAFDCLPEEGLRAARDRREWEVLLHPAHRADEGAGGDSRTCSKAAEEPVKKPPLRPEEWDPFMGAPYGEDGGL